MLLLLLVIEDDVAKGFFIERIKLGVAEGEEETGRGLQGGESNLHHQGECLGI